jgi:hypothetical protein
MNDIRAMSILSMVHDVLQLSGWKDVKERQIFSPGLNLP